MAYTYPYPHLALTVDAVVFVEDPRPKVLLIRRAKAPFEGMWALPGGFVELTETCLSAVHRELHEETGIEGVDLRFLDYFDTIERDPRERTLSLAFWGVAGQEGKTIRAADDASDASWHALDALPGLAFDHASVIARAISEWGKRP